jgi:putative molybdopterin biosynthesis protein
MTYYLRDIPLEKALAQFQTALEKEDLWRVLNRESISLDENAFGRVLAEPVWANISSPHYHASAMDGFAVLAENTTGAQPSHPIVLLVVSSKSKNGNGQAFYLNTGAVLPEGFDAVIPIENVEPITEGRISTDARNPEYIRIRAAVTPWSNVRLMGEDIVQTQLVLAAGQILRPVDLGAVAASGHQTIKVACKPRVAILPTGTELVPIGSSLKPGDIVEYNSLVLAAQVKQWGGEPSRYPIIPDEFDAICNMVSKVAQENDLVLLNAGSSAGSEDFSAQVVEKLGTLLVHGVAVRPGHPVILGLIKVGNESDNKSLSSRPKKNSADKRSVHGKRIVPIIGVPGYPVSAALTGELFVEPLIAKWTGRHPVELPLLNTKITRKVSSPGGDDDFLRVVVGKVGERWLAAPLGRGAGVITSLTRADGLVLIPRGIQGFKSGENVNVRLYRSLNELEKTIFCIGSHDMLLDFLAQYLAKADRRLVSANVGSLGGLISLQRNEAHLSGSHLLDPASGEYNIPYVQQYLKGIPVKVFGFVQREQGLMLERGNPKRIRTLNDLPTPNVRFVNRQRGSGTRILLDYHINMMKIDVRLITGYDQEEYTHLGVASAVASGRADCGLGIPAAAQALDLDFIPLFSEKYQLIIPTVFSNSKLLKPLFEVMDDSDFREDVLRLPGYDIAQMGRLIFEM